MIKHFKLNNLGNQMIIRIPITDNLDEVSLHGFLTLRKIGDMSFMKKGDFKRSDLINRSS